MKGDKPKWVDRRNGVSTNISIGSNCRCWMCRAVMKWVNSNHFTTGRQRQQLEDKLLTYLCYRMGYSGCDDVNVFQMTLPQRGKK